ncbi:MAG: hypothetical protein ACRCX8_07240 [Sarcina sp.]
MAAFNFNTQTDISFGLPYVARVFYNNDNLIKKYIKSKIDVTEDGVVIVNCRYEADNYTILEIKEGGADDLASYYFVNRSMLSFLGYAKDKHIENRIKSYLCNELSAVDLTTSIDEIMEESFEREAKEIFTIDNKKEEINSHKQNNIIKMIKEICEDAVNIQCDFNYGIYSTRHERLNINYVDDNLIYIEDGNIKLAISSDKINNYNEQYNRLELFMKDNVKIIFNK